MYKLRSDSTEPSLGRTRLGILLDQADTSWLLEIYRDVCDHQNTCHTRETMPPVAEAENHVLPVLPVGDIALPIIRPLSCDTSLRLVRFTSQKNRPTNDFTTSFPCFILTATGVPAAALLHGNLEILLMLQRGWWDPRVRHRAETVCLAAATSFVTLDAQKRLPRARGRESFSERKTTNKTFNSTIRMVQRAVGRMAVVYILRCRA